jgi:hypothetical protein
MRQWTGDRGVTRLRRQRPADPDVKDAPSRASASRKEGGRRRWAAPSSALETIDAMGAGFQTPGAPADREEQAERNKLSAVRQVKEPALDKKSMPYLERSIEQALKGLDPSLVPDRDSMNSVRGGQMSQEELQQRLRKIQEELGKKKDGDQH